MTTNEATNEDDVRIILKGGGDDLVVTLPWSVWEHAERARTGESPTKVAEVTFTLPAAVWDAIHRARSKRLEGL